LQRLRIRADPRLQKRLATRINLFSTDSFIFASRQPQNEDVAESMVRTGFKYVVFIGDHDQNQPLLRALASKLDDKHRAEGVRVFFSSDAYAKTNQQIDEYLRVKGYPPSRHGGISDTSLTWAANPDYVHPERLVLGAPVPPPGATDRSRAPAR
jgi:creatinine amidohydrolase/Fe(II)-dependent formamide hydrolase-like protein